MRVGVTTFHRALNYGATFQTYALQKTVEKLGAECEVIDYRCPFLEKLYKPMSLKTLLNVRKIAYIVLKNGNAKNNRENFIEFYKNHINVSDECYYDNNDLTKANKLYDTFITGSDQVWSYYCAGFDKTYFLDFVTDNKKKNSYAASFGVSTIPDEHKKVYQDHLNSFTNISVREEQGADICKNLLNKEVLVSLDPTMLLDKSEWYELIADIEKELKKYMLVYLLFESKEMISMAKKIAKEKNLEIIYINDRLYKKRGMKNYSRVSPRKWLSLFYNAEAIVTNSFHGICFSINFEKEFYVQYSKGLTKVISRLKNAIDIFGLEGRVFSELQSESYKVEKIDYKKVAAIMQRERKDSMDYLTTIIENDQQR